MSYLLTQIFMCLLGTAILFFAMGWLLRRRFSGVSSTDNLVTDTERNSWQTSLDILKSRLETETSQRVEAEKALGDLRTQQSQVSTLEDHHAGQIQTLTDQLADKSKVLDDRQARLQQLQARITELEAQQNSAGNLAKERDSLNTQLAALTAQAGTRDQSLRAANEDAAKQTARIADLEKQLADQKAQITKLTPVADENTKLKAQISEAAPKLNAAVSAGAELLALRARVADIEPKLKLASAESSKQLLDAQAAAQLASDENKKLKEQIAQLQPASSRGEQVARAAFRVRT